MKQKVFPARAGMSPRDSGNPYAGDRVPRASGDEPAKMAHLHTETVCSPRERG